MIINFRRAVKKQRTSTLNQDALDLVQAHSVTTANMPLREKVNLLATPILGAIYGVPKKETSMLNYVPETFTSLYNIPLGQDLWIFLNEPETVLRMKTASDLGKPALEGIEETLLERFEQHVETLSEDRWKQMMGHMTRQVMAAAGYVIGQQNVKVNSAVFTRATRYDKSGSFTFHAHRGGGRAIALTGDRAGTNLPKDQKWAYWKSFESGIRARIGFGLEDEKNAITEIQQKGYYLHDLPRLFRAAK